jgi:peptidyl-prolyl cis-trans isomerase SurA
VNVKTKLSDLLRSLLFIGLFISCLSHAQIQQLDRVVAVVDDDVVMQSQLSQRVNEVRRSIQQQGAGVPPDSVLQQQVLERLIIENIQLQIGERMGVRIADEELNQAMQTIAQRNGMSIEQLRDALRQDGLSFDQAREQIRREMVISRVRQRRVAERIEVNRQEVINFLASEQGRQQLSEEYRLANILLPLAEGSSAAQIQKAGQEALEVYSQLQQGASFAQMAVARSASENALDGGEMGWRKAAQMPPPFDELISALAVGEVTQPVRTPGGFLLIKLLEKRGGDTQLRDEVHVRHILVKSSEIRSQDETRRLIVRLHERLLAGDDFAELARSFSEDPGSALNGGDLDWVDPGIMVPEFQSVMAQTATGRISAPFESPYGWHVLQVLDRRSTDSSAQMREQQAVNLLRSRKYDEELQGWLLEIRNEAYVEIKL